MLRNRVKPNQQRLRLIFDNLNRLKNEREAGLKEINLLATKLNPLETTPPRAWDGFKNMDAYRNNVRMFEQVTGSSKFLSPSAKTSDFQPKVTRNKATSLSDVATGLNEIVKTTQNLSDEDLYHLRKLTTTMVWASSMPGKAVKEVFYWLQKFKSMPHLLELFTPYAWKFLWAFETSPIPSFRARLLGDLMTMAGAQFSEDQEIGYIGGMFWNEAREDAFVRWRQLVEKSTSPAVWSLGVRMFSLEQTPHKAIEVVERMIERIGYTEHKVWIPVVLAYNHIYDSKNAWETYQKLCIWSKKNNSRITAHQYDDLAMSFLDGGQPGMGLEIYKHMVFSGIGAFDRQQTETYQNLAVAVKEAQNSAETPELLNKLSLDALNNLPKRIADKYFYGGWMRNLMKMGRTDLASFLVRDVMASNGQPPDSIHMNWLIQGFLEEGNLPMVEMLAQEMIDLRLKTNDKKCDSNHSSYPNACREDLQGDTKNALCSAPATVQTFSILINYFSRRQKMDKIVSLCSQMRECDIHANSYIMNHLLYALFRVHDLSRLASSFESMIHPEGVSPDYVSFLIIWSAMYKSYTHHLRKYSEFLTPRALFKHTLENLPRKATIEDEDRMLKIWHHMIKSFMVDRDLEGALLALHVGSKVWSMPIDESITQDVTFGVLKARPWDPKLTGGTPPKVTPQTVEASIDSLKFLAEHIALARRRRRGGVGTGRSKWVDEKLKELSSLESLTILLKKELGNSGLTQDDLQRARKDMGVFKVDLNAI